MNKINEELIREYLKYNHLTGLVIWKKNRKGCRGLGEPAGSVNVSKNGKRYILLHLNGSQYRIHRICWFMYYGSHPHGEIDHIDGDGLNNKISNLRDVSSSINSRNQRLSVRNSSGVVGVFWCKPSSKWGARIHDKGKNVHLGLFNSFEEAVIARKKAEVNYCYHSGHGSKRPL